MELALSWAKRLTLLKKSDSVHGVNQMVVSLRLYFIRFLMIYNETFIKTLVKYMVVRYNLSLGILKGKNTVKPLNSGHR